MGVVAIAVNTGSVIRRRQKLLNVLGVRSGVSWQLRISQLILHLNLSGWVSGSLPRHLLFEVTLPMGIVVVCIVASVSSFAGLN